jgi:metallo-beta-lactamase family protein
MKIKFAGAATKVTRIKRLIELWDNKKVLLGCGMYQSLGKQTFGLNDNDVVEPPVDHSGLIPKYVKNGFEGPIYCTKATFALCKIMLRDSAFIQEFDVRYSNKRNNRSENCVGRLRKTGYRDFVIPERGESFEL